MGHLAHMHTLPFRQSLVIGFYAFSFCKEKLPDRDLAYYVESLSVFYIYILDTAAFNGCLASKKWHRERICQVLHISNSVSPVRFNEHGQTH